MVGLKYQDFVGNESRAVTFNRTMVGLKSLVFAFNELVLLAFNRTMVGLKLNTAADAMIRRWNL